VLFTQFHDIFDGCAVPDSYRDARRRGAKALAAAGRVTQAAQRALGYFDSHYQTAPGERRSIHEIGLPR